jgi:uncharacterized protein (TIRG00374 family)
VSLDEVGQALAHAQVLPIGVVVGCVLGSLITRAARWRIYFLPARHVPFGPLVDTLAISYMASTILPLRAGELVRALFLARRAAVAVPRVVGTIVLEKLFDFLALGLMLMLLLARPNLPAAAQVGGGFLATVILVGFGFVVALAVWRAPTLELVATIESWLPFGLGHRLRLEHAARQFAEGTDSLRVPRLWLPLLAWTAITWVLSVGSIWGGIVALGAEPALETLLFVAVLTSSSQAVPSSPGYVGVYHAVATYALTTFGIDLPTAFGIAVLTHAFSYGSLVVAGLIAMWAGGYTIGDILAGARGKAAPRSSTGVDRVPVAPDA